MMDKHQNELLGALVGLVRAVEKNAKTPETDALLLEGLQKLSAHAETLSALTQRVHMDKAAVAPGCVYCAMPCGSTADADMDAVWNARPAVVHVKKEILRVLREAAPKLAERADEQALYLLHEGLFFLGEEQGPEALERVLRDLEPLSKI